MSESEIKMNRQLLELVDKTLKERDSALPPLDDSYEEE